jgi:hypothetical protein
MAPWSSRSSLPGPAANSSSPRARRASQAPRAVPHRVKEISATSSALLAAPRGAQRAHADRAQRRPRARAGCARVSKGFRCRAADAARRARALRVRCGDWA